MKQIQDKILKNLEIEVYTTMKISFRKRVHVKQAIMGAAEITYSSPTS